ncbi:DUF453 domain-containing protein [Cristinia sonorae]|uniref:DUF453 domain-containing protein n=1 Tax=Cristinia sonorae TaxID=1940300 RepID=A0A8K0XQC2_9AGAR|nr:DUF453 domain-containing protein [Cristinia sonorae]
MNHHGLFRLRLQSIERLATRNVSNPLPATFLRGGTSKGIFINRADLPEDRRAWDRIFLGIMGSPDIAYGRQLNGMGGGISSLSKICVVETADAKTRAEGCDVSYTFVQVGVRDDSVDYSGNCGNLSSMIGVFALDESLCTPYLVNNKAGTATVRAYNTNTGKRVDTTFPVAIRDGTPVPMLHLRQTTMAGVPGEASRIVLEFVSPAGARTGKLLPTNSPKDTIEVRFNDHDVKIPATLIDVTNPTVFLAGKDLHPLADTLFPNTLFSYENDSILELLETIRQRGAEMMGLSPHPKSQPKIAVISPRPTSPFISPRPPATQEPENVIDIKALSMGVLHKAVPLTMAVCLGAASKIPGTLAWEIIQQAQPPILDSQSRLKHPRKPREDLDSSLVTVMHPSGEVEVGAEFGEDGSVKSGKVVRTGRRLMKGVVWW